MGRILTISVVALVIIAAVCAESAPPPGAIEVLPTTPAPVAEEVAAFPVTVGGVTIPARPERIVSLSATHTEMLYAVGAGPEVVATDLFSNFPPDAEQTEKVDSFNLSVEAVAALEPDLVILAFDPGEVVAGLELLGIPALLFDAAATLEDAYIQMEEVGAASGHAAEAAQLVATLQREIDAIVSQIQRPVPAFTYYHELDQTLFTATSSTFIGELYGLLGMENVADPADEDGFGFPQLSAEFLIDADPDFVFLADTKCCGQTGETFAARPSFGVLSAVQNGRVIELDDDIASRWGPRVGQLLRMVAGAVYQLEAVG
ncbi:MAG: ABC transporter substrate-binding protein [Acidimicrobiia bacterium]